MNATIVLLIFALAASFLFFIQYIHTRMKINVLDKILVYKKDTHGYYKNRRLIYKEDMKVYMMFFCFSIVMSLYLVIQLYI